MTCLLSEGTDSAYTRAYKRSLGIEMLHEAGPLGGAWGEGPSDVNSLSSSGWQNRKILFRRKDGGEPSVEPRCVPHPEAMGFQLPWDASLSPVQCSQP